MLCWRPARLVEEIVPESTLAPLDSFSCVCVPLSTWRNVSGCTKRGYGCYAASLSRSPEPGEDVILNLSVRGTLRGNGGLRKPLSTSNVFSLHSKSKSITSMALPHPIFQRDMQLNTSVRTHRRSATDDLNTRDSKSLLSVKHHLILFCL